MKKKILAILMIVFMCLPLLMPVTANAASTSYKNWLQSDSEWGSINLGKSSYTMKSSGCLVTAIAMLICHSGSADASSFTPATLVNYLNNNGGFTSGGALYWEKVNGAADGFYLVSWKESLSGMTQAEKTSKMAELLNDGYAVIISVRNGGHWVALDRVEGDKVYMMDPASGSTDLYGTYSESGIDRLALYKGKNKCGSVTGNQGSSGGSSNTTPTPSQTGKVNCSSLYVRSGAGTNNSIVTSVTKNTTVTILGEAKDSNGTLWYKISVNGQTGYSSAQYITVTSSGSSGSSGSSTNNSGSQAASGSGVVNCSSLNVRKAAGTSSDVVTTISRNQAVTIKSTAKDSSGNQWYGVEFTKSGKSYSGYVFAEYITLNKDSGNSGNSGGSSSSGNETSIAAVVNCDVLNMRADAGTGSSVIKTLTKGTEVTITGEKKDSGGTTWYKISVGGKTGYVHSSYLTKKDSNNASGSNSSGNTNTGSGETMIVAYDAVNVRSGAGTSKGVVTVVHKGDKVTITGQDKDGSGNTWYQIKTSSGKTGYIRADLVTASTSSGNSSSSGSSGSNNSSAGSGEKMAVAYDGVNMRNGAGTSHGVVEVIYLEDTLTVLGQDKDSSGNTWYKVKAASGNTGYIRADMLKAAGSSNQSSGSSEKTTGQVSGGWLNVRSGAGTSNKVLTMIPEGTKVTILETTKDSSGSQWYHITVSYGGSNYDGYVSAQYIK